MKNRPANRITAMLAAGPEPDERTVLRIVREGLRSQTPVVRFQPRSDAA